MENNRPVLVRITTVAMSLHILLKGQMKYMKEKGMEVYMVSNPDSDLVHKLEAEEGCKHIAVRMTRRITPLRDFFSLIKLIILLRKIKPEIVHSHTPKAGLLGMVAAWVCGVPIRLHTVAGLPVMESKGFKKRILSATEQITYSFATKVIPNSIGVKNYIVENKWVSKDKLIFLGKGSSNGVDMQYFNLDNSVENQADKIRDQLGIKEDNFVFLFLGRIVADKGINELVDAFVSIHESYPETRLILVGPFESRLDPISKYTSEIIQTHPNIYSTGFVNDVRPFIALSNTLVLPSYREGFPNAPLQAASMGVPSIVSNIIGCNEIVINEINGLLVKVKDVNSLALAMKKLVSNRQLTSALGGNARESISKNYNQLFVQSGIYDLYSTLLKSISNVSTVHQTIS